MPELNSDILMLCLEHVRLMYLPLVVDKWNTVILMWQFLCYFMMIGYLIFLPDNNIININTCHYKNTIYLRNGITMTVRHYKQ